MALILTFATIHEALAAEKAAQGIHWPRPAHATQPGACTAELVPLPPQVRGDCGFGLFLDTIEEEEAKCIDGLRGAGIVIAGVYRVTERDAGGGGRKEKSYEWIA
jgi:hypothetical protein